MLVLARKKNETVTIGENIEIVVLDVYEDKVKLGIKAPKDMKVFRKELLVQVELENKQSIASEKVDLSILTNVLNKK